MGNDISSPAGARAEEARALLHAVLAGDVSSMNSLLRLKPGLIFSHSRDGENLWHAAATGGHPEMAAAVHAAVEGVRVGQNKQDKLRAQVNQGFNQVHQAVNQVIASTVPLALPSALNLPMGANLDINAQTRAGSTPLMAAVKAGKPAMVAALLELGADAWLGDNSGATALHHAAWLGQTECLECLLRHAAREEEQPGRVSAGVPRLVETTTNTGLSPLHWAAWRGQCQAVKLLVNAGAPIAAPSSSDTMGMVAANAGSTPLHLAAMKGEVGVIRLLLRANRKLLALVASDPSLAAAAAAADGQAGSSSGAREDVRRLTDGYGKTAGRLAWDMQRSDLALILDPKTPLEQAIGLAATSAAAKAKAAAATAAGAPAAQHISRSPEQQQQSAMLPSAAPTSSSNVSSSIKHGGVTGGARQAGEAAVVVAAAAAAAADTAAEVSEPKQQQQQEGEGDAGYSAFVSAAAGGGAGSAAAGGGAGGAAAGGGATKAPRGPEPPAHLTCPITNELLKDPVRASDGVAYERDAIEVWLHLGNTHFPGGHAPISSTQLTPDSALKQEADAWREASVA